MSGVFFKHLSDMEHFNFKEEECTKERESWAHLDSFLGSAAAAVEPYNYFAVDVVRTAYKEFHHRSL